MASMNTRLNIKKLDRNIVQKHRGLKQVGFKQLGPGVETGVHGVSNDDTAVAQRWLEDKQPEEKTNINCFVKESSSAIGFKTPIDMLRFFGWLASIKQVMLKPVKVKNMGFNKSWEYKKTFIGSGVGTSSVQVSQGVKFEVEPQEDLAFEVGPLRNDYQGDGSHNVQTQDLIYYHSVRDRGQHLAWELFSYRKGNNKAIFVVDVVDKIYAHESLTFNNTVACEVISKWNARLKNDIDARSMCTCLATVARNAVTAAISITGSIHQVEIWDTNGLLDKAKGNVLGMKIVMDQSRDCDVEKNSKWSCIYAVGSQDYQMVCTRLDIASTDVCMLDKFDHGLQTYVQVFMDFNYTMGRSITVVEAVKEAIWLKGLVIESGFELMIVAGIATGALSKVIPGLRFQHRLKLLRIEEF
ncbi:hypothetical protein Tco_1274530 [Tanacetum coccineum]